MRRVTRLTNGFSLAKPYPTDPGDGRGIADPIWTCEEFAALLD